ncbi:hypothetical protein Emag_004397 [Eimeria magna]
MAASGSGWCLIESDPGVFSALVEQVGVKGVSFAEVYGLDEASFAALEGPESHSKVLGFIFLFNWARDKRTTAGDESRPTVDPTSDDAPFFAAQTVENACASQAILAVLLNRREQVADLGGPLTALYEFTKDFRDPAMRGEAIGGCDAIRKAHNSFRAETSFEVVDTDDTKSKDAFHFVSYVPKGDKVFELDGLKQGPVCVGTTTDGDWKEVVRQEVVRRIEEIQAQGEELRFNLMAVTTNPLDSILAELAKAQGLAAAALEKIEGKTPDGSFDLPNEPEQLEKVRRESLDRVALLEEQLRAEEAKRAVSFPPACFF